MAGTFQRLSEATVVEGLVYKVELRRGESFLVPERTALFKTYGRLQRCLVPLSFISKVNRFVKSISSVLEAVQLINLMKDFLCHSFDLSG